MVWIVLLLLVSVGFLIAACVIEDRRGFRASLPFGIFGFIGIAWTIYLYIDTVIPFIIANFMANL
jgi:hypothetical protein